MFRGEGNFGQNMVTVARPFGDAILGKWLRASSPRAERRIWTAEAMSVGLPHEFKEKPGMLGKLERLLEEGYGVAGLVPHFSYGDFFRVGSALLLNVEGYSEKDILTPIALHQLEDSWYKSLVMNGLQNYTDIRLASIVTEDTLLKEWKRRVEGKKIRWENMKGDASTLAYLIRAAQVMEKAGVVLYAPSTGRRPVLLPFKEEPVRALDLALKRKKVQKKAHMFFGLEVPGVEDYMAKSKFGMHAGEKYIVTLGLVLTDEELKARAAANGRTIDEEAYQIMLELAPEAYRPPQAPASPVTIG